MWTRSYSKIYPNISKKDIWKLWSDINNWHKWDKDIDYAKLDMPFKTGSHFMLKPKGGPVFKIQLTEVIPQQKYVDCTKFFGAKMYGIHEMQELPNNSLKLTTTMQVIGILSFLWIKLVAQNIVDGLEEQTDNLVKIAKEKK